MGELEGEGLMIGYIYEITLLGSLTCYLAKHDHGKTFSVAAAAQVRVKEALKRAVVAK